jgi:hypothetical protein
VERERALAMLAEVGEAAGRLGMADLVRRVEEGTVFR